MKKRTKKIKLDKKIKLELGNKTENVVVEPFTASVKIFGVVYSAQGNSVKEAIANLNVGKAGGNCVMTVSRGEKFKDRVISNIQIRRLFNGGKLMREIALKGISQLFEGIFA